MNVSRRKNIAVILILAMIFTSIPFLSYGTQVEEPSPIPEVSLEDEITTEDVGKTDAIEEKSTENSTTFDLGGNQKMLVLYGGEVRYEDKDGNLIDYDPSLVQITDQESIQGESLTEYAYENKQSDSKQYMPETLTEDSPVLMEKDKYKIQMAPISGEFASEKVTLEKEETLNAYEEIEEKKVKAVYESETEDSAYEYISINNGIKENLILKEKPETNVYKYRLSLKGLIPEVSEDKYINLLDKETGKTVAVIDKPFMNDASGDAYSEDIETIIEEDTAKEGDYLLTLTLSPKYLNTKERAYPVTVDPSVTWQGSSEVFDAYTISGYPTTNFYNSGVKKMVVGRGVDGVHRTFIKFDSLLATVKGKYVDSAKFTMYETAGSDTGRTVSMYNLSTTWSAYTINWNNRPPASGGALASAVSNGKTNHAMVFNLTNHVRKYANGTYGNYGMTIRDSTETAKSYTEYYGSRTTATSYRPKLVVTYYDGPTTATSVTATKTYVKKGSSVSLKYAGIASKNLANVQYRVATVNETTGAIINSDYKPYTNLGVSTSSGTVTIPGGSTLPEGRYKIYLRGVDAGGIKGTGLGATIYIDGTKPSLNGVSVSPKTSVDNYDSGVKAKISFTATDKYLSKVEVLVDGKVVHTTTAKGAGSYTLQEGDITVSGAHDIQVRATDKAGNVTNSAVSKYYTDMEAPAITKAAISPATTGSVFSNVTTPKVTFDVADVNLKNAAVYVRNEDSTEKKLVYETTNTGAISYTFKGGELGEGGTKTIIVRAEDKSGNVTEKTLKYYLDITKPEFTDVFLSPVTSSLIYSKNLSPRLAFTIEEASFKELMYSADKSKWVSGGTLKEGSILLSSTLFNQGKGKYTIYVKAIDKAGNESEIEELDYYADPNIGDTDYVPTHLKATEYYGKRIISWQVNGFDASKVRWKLYRGKTEDFDLKDGTLIEDNLEGTSYADKEILAKGKYYYRIICTNAGETKILKDDVPSETVEIDNTVDKTNFADTLGSKDYLTYHNFDLPIGSGTVEKSSGNVNYSQTDYELSGGQLDYGMTRTYNSGDERTSMLGTGWSDSYHKELYTGANGNVYFVDSDGTNYLFAKEAKGYTCSETKEYTLKEVKEGYQIETKDNTLYSFNTSGQLVLTKEPNGSTVRNIYDAIGRLSKVVSKEDTSGEKSLEFVYDRQSPYQLQEIGLPDKTKMTYEQGRGHLYGVSHESGLFSRLTYQYAYNDDGKISTIKDGEGNPYTITYAGEKASNVAYPNGESYSLAYEEGKTTVTKINENGTAVYTTSAQFDEADGRVISETDTAGKTTKYEYVAGSFLVAKTIQDIGYEQISGNNISINTKENVVETSYAYDENDNVTSQESSDGTSTDYTYDEEDQLIHEVSTNDGKTISNISYDYDEAGNEILQNDDINDTITQTDYDEEGNAEREVAREEGITTSVTNSQYDEQGNVENQTSQSANVKASETNTYDAMGRVLTTISDGTTTTNTYDFLGRTVKVETTTGDTTSVTNSEYNGNGTLVSQTDERGVTTSYIYDKINRKIIETNSETGATTTTYGYDQNIKINDGLSGRTEALTYTETMTNSKGVITAVKYMDVSGETVKEVNGSTFTDSTYDGSKNAVVTYNGNLTDSKHEISLALYDDKGKNFANISQPEVTDSGYAIGRESVATYQEFDGEDKLIKSTDGMGNVTTYTYEPGGKVGTVDVASDGVDMTATYTQEGVLNMVTRTDANGNSSVETTDAAGLVKSTTDIGTDDTMLTTSYTYDKDGNLTGTTYGDGSRVMNEYNQKKQLIKKITMTSGGEEESETTYEYDQFGQVVKTTYTPDSGTAVTTEREYDKLGRTTAVTTTYGGGTAQKITYTYDNEGKLMEADYPEKMTSLNGVKYIYDDYGHVLTITDDKDQVIKEYTYDSMYKVSQAKDYTKPGSSDFILKDYEYTHTGLTSKMTYTENGNKDKVLEQYAYTYDKNGHIVSRNRINKVAEKPLDETRTYTYDSYGRLTKTDIKDNTKEDSTQTVTYGFDGVGNRTSKKDSKGDTRYEYNGLNQLVMEETPEAEVEYIYDDKGNQITRENVTEGTTTENTYTVESQLQQITETKGETTTTIQENDYDQDGIRVSKKENNVTRQYYYDEGKVLYTSDNGNTSSENVYGAEGNLIGSYRVKDTNAEYYAYTKDVQGSTSMITGEDKKAAVVYDYDDFGTTGTIGEATIDNQICYTGGVYDGKTGLYYLNARYYDPSTGRFISQDTYRGEINDPGQWHLYAYCANNPVNYVDPSGHFSLKVDTKNKLITASVSFKDAEFIGAVGTAYSAAMTVKKTKEFFLKRVVQQVSRELVKRTIPVYGIISVAIWFASNYASKKGYKSAKYTINYACQKIKKHQGGRTVTGYRVSTKTKIELFKK